MDVLVGLLAVAIGAMLCFVGYLALRAVISIWGAFVGFTLGAGLVANLTGEGYLDTPLGWIVALVVAVLFGAVAYLYYAVSVVIAMGAIGFVLGTTLMTALGVEWSWVVALVGLVIGVVLALIAIAADLPMVLLAVLSALAGASTILAGALLVVGSLTTDELTADTTRTVELGSVWYVLYLGLALAGTVVQLRSAANRSGTLRETWATR